MEFGSCTPMMRWCEYGQPCCGKPLKGNRKMEERMDAMTPNQEANPEEPGTPAALRMLGDSLAKQVELGIVIEQAHVSEQRAHKATRRRMSVVEADRARLQRYNLELLEIQDQVRTALAGGVHGGVASPDGDVLAEARELFAKSYNLERELLEAKALLESATAQNANWERVRREWQDRVHQVLGLPEPAFGTEPEPDAEDIEEEAAEEPELGQEYDRRQRQKEGTPMPEVEPGNRIHTLPSEV